MYNFGKNIKYLINNNKNMTIIAASDELNMSVIKLRSIINSDQYPNKHLLLDICNFLDLSYEWAVIKIVEEMGHKYMTSTLCSYFSKETVDNMKKNMYFSLKFE